MRSDQDPFSSLAKRLRQIKAAKAQHGHRQAAVLLALTDAVRPEVILTRRAQHMRQHRGEVALPGGKWEPGDSSLWHTALRESAEEVALVPGQVNYLGRLPPMISRYGLTVTPFVGRVPEQLSLTPNLEELDRIFQVPLDFFCVPERLGVRVVERDGVRYRCPSFQYQEHEIWGLTALIILQLASLAADSPLEHEWAERFRM